MSHRRVRTQLRTGEWIGTVGALAGAAIVALQLSWSGWGFVVMAMFSGLLLVLAITAARWPYVALFTGYELVNAIGIYRWLVAPPNGT